MSMPLRPKKILVATDFSSTARAAADAAGVLARAFDGRVTLLHVVPLSLYADAASHLDRTAFSSPELQASVRKRVQQDAEAELTRLRSDGVFAEFVTADGPPPAEIARMAKDGAYDLVVLGTHGRTGLMHLALGSVAENVVRLSPTPVLVVRPDASAAAP
jgi:nucleotide-binding universal stress UspA family protein